MPMIAVKCCRQRVRAGEPAGSVAVLGSRRATARVRAMRREVVRTIRVRLKPNKRRCSANARTSGKVRERLQRASTSGAERLPARVASRREGLGGKITEAGRQAARCEQPVTEGRGPSSATFYAACHVTARTAVKQVESRTRW